MNCLEGSNLGTSVAKRLTYVDQSNAQENVENKTPVFITPLTNASCYVLMVYVLYRSSLQVSLQFSKPLYTTCILLCSSHFETKEQVLTHDVQCHLLRKLPVLSSSVANSRIRLASQTHILQILHFVTLFYIHSV